MIQELKNLIHDNDNLKIIVSSLKQLDVKDNDLKQKTNYFKLGPINDHWIAKYLNEIKELKKEEIP